MKTPILHMRFGPFGHNDRDLKMRYVYFIRRQLLPVPQYYSEFEAFCELPMHFVQGSLKGPLTDHLRVKVNEIYRKAFEFQFLEPIIVDRKVEILDNIQKEIPMLDKESVASIGLVDLSKPSQFRFKALKQATEDE